jgi:hypothetical protein
MDVSGAAWTDHGRLMDRAAGDGDLPRESWRLVRTPRCRMLPSFPVLTKGRTRSASPWTTRTGTSIFGRSQPIRHSSRSVSRAIGIRATDVAITQSEPRTRDVGTTNLRLDSPHIRAGVVLGEPTSGARPSPPDVCGSTWWKPWKRQISEAWPTADMTMSRSHPIPTRSVSH